jgi:NADH-quinone oxidoreductase subunit C
MIESLEQLAARINERFGQTITSCRLAAGELTVEVGSKDLLSVAQALRDEPAFAFSQLMDLCGVDYSAYGEADWQTEAASNQGFSRGVSSRAEPAETSSRARFAVVYHLLSIQQNQRLRLRVLLAEEPPKLPSVIGVWACADWYEREAFDLFGILFDGHPDLRRLLTDYGFIGHPFRKDFPLEGHVEVRYDPEKGRVVYQPVTIENRVLVPRVIRPAETRSETPGVEP